MGSDLKPSVSLLKPPDFHPSEGRRVAELLNTLHINSMEWTFRKPMIMIIFIMIIPKVIQFGPGKLVTEI